MRTKTGKRSHSRKGHGSGLEASGGVKGGIRRENPWGSAAGASAMAIEGGGGSGRERPLLEGESLSAPVGGATKEGPEK